MGVAVENAEESTYLGAVLTNTYNDSPAIKRRIAIAKNASVALNNIYLERLKYFLNDKVEVFKLVNFPNCVIWV